MEENQDKLIGHHDISLVLKKKNSGKNAKSEGEKGKWVAFVNSCSIQEEPVLFSLEEKAPRRPDTQQYTHLNSAVPHDSAGDASVTGIQRKSSGFCSNMCLLSQQTHLIHIH